MDALAENRNRYLALGLTLLFHVVLCLGCTIVIFTAPLSSYKVPALTKAYPVMECFELNEMEELPGGREHHSQIHDKPAIIAAVKSNPEPSPAASEKMIADETGEEVNLLKEILRRKAEKQNEASVSSQPSAGVETGNKDQGLAKESSGEYYVKDRKLTEKPLLEQDSDKEGIVVVEIYVAENGNVVKAIPGQRGSTTTDELLYRKAQEAALKAKFNARPGVKEQRGTYTFVFTLE